MPNSFDTDARGPSHRQLLMVGACFVLIAAVVVALAIAKSKGKFERIVRVSAELVNVGDGLPARSDVKFRGVLVGSVAGVVPAQIGKANVVHIDLKPEYASGIPNTVTARVVPSNVFAVSSVQLVDNGESATPLRANAVIHEDEAMPTVLFQSTLNKFRQVFMAVGREPTADSIGVLAALGEATYGRGDKLRRAGGDLDKIVTQLNSVIAPDAGPSTLSALTDAADRLQNAAPELFDALGSAVKPMQTLAEKQVALTDFLSAGQFTIGTLGDAFDNQTDRLINITTQLTPVIGVLADHADQFHPIFTRLQRVSDQVKQIWRPDTNSVMVYATISLTPTRTYVRQDCPRYGELEGPSCQTAPEIPTAPALLPALRAHSYPPPPGLPENRQNLAPPRDSMPPPESPVLPEDSGLLPAEAPPPAAPPSPQEPPPPAAPGSIHPQAAVAGSIGPVGSRQEAEQLGHIVGGDVNAATVLLLGPLARGTTVHIAPDPGGRP